MKKKSFNDFQRENDDFESNFTDEFYQKYKLYTAAQLQEEAKEISKKNSELALINKSLEEENADIMDSRQSQSDSLSNITKYNMNLQVKKQNLQIKMNVDIENERKKLEEIEKEIQENDKIINDLSKEFCFNSGGAEQVEERQQRIVNSLNRRKLIKEIQEIKAQINSNSKIYYEKEEACSQLEEENENKKKELEMIKKENKELEEEIKNRSTTSKNLQDIKKDIQRLREKEKRIISFKEENQKLEESIEEQKKENDKLKLKRILEMPSAQDSWGTQYQSQLINFSRNDSLSFNELKAKRDALKQRLAMRESKLKRAQNDLSESLLIMKASIEAIGEYQQKQIIPT